MPKPSTLRLAAAWPALLATVLLLILLLGGHAWMESRRLEQQLSRELEDRGAALIGVLEASSRNAIAGQALLEEVVAQRLLDNARFVDSFVARSPRAAALLERVVAENKLARIEILDARGNPLPIPPPGTPAAETAGPPWAGRPRAGDGAGAPGGRDDPEPAHPRMMMRRMMRAPQEPPPPHPPRGRHDMPFMWGQRWGMRGDPTRIFPGLPRDARVRRFWEGSEFGVAVPAQTFPGIIAVHADADYLLSYRRQIGLQRLIQDLARQAGVAGADLLDGTLTVLASSSPAGVGRRVDDPFLRAGLEAGGVRGRRTTGPDGREAYEVVKPFAIEQDRRGLVRLTLGTAGLDAAAAQARRQVVRYSLGLLLVGIAGAVAIFWLQARHLAERRALETAMVREQRLSAMGNLAAGAAHEIRNPLNAISVGLQRLRLEFAPAAAPDREEYARFTRLMQAEVARLDTIVDRFLALARPLRLSLTEESLAGLLQETLALLGSQAAAQGVEIRAALGGADVRVRMDRQQLTQAVMNVLLNALQAMPHGGRLEVRVAAAPETVEVGIADSGPGIPPAHADRIFEPYFTTKEGGTGLGLALSRKIVQEHGGDLRLAASPAGGAAFVIALPRLAPGA
ncbi:MAG: PAS domain-containing sensor histidine kinase [Candidatus Methylomirabilales bacterium]